MSQVMAFFLSCGTSASTWCKPLLTVQYKSLEITSLFHPRVLLFIFLSLFQASRKLKLASLFKKHSKLMIRGKLGPMKTNQIVKTGVAIVALLVLTFITFSVVFPKKYVYGLMIDAGSTGSRMHTFVFLRKSDGGLDLVTEDFFPIKPGLSSYKDDVKKSGASLLPLLERSKQIVPAKYVKDTPVFLRATAGLRMTGEETAEAILQDVRSVLKSSGFRFDDDSWAKVMDGNDEGIFSWITVNYLLDNTFDNTVGTLEMGGGSSQIAFVPTEKPPVDCADDATEKISFKGYELPLYTFSHLGYGIKKAKATMMNYFAKNGYQDANPCLNKGTQDVAIPFDSSVLKMTGSSDWSTCVKLVTQEMGPKVSRCPCGVCTYGDKSQPKPIKEYYAFAFYMERTINIGLKSPLSLRDIRKKGEEVCSLSVEEVQEKYPKIQNGAATELCFDLAFIYSHLKSGHGLPESEKESDVKITVVDKIKGIELGWSLGAMFHELSKLDAQK